MVLVLLSTFYLLCMILSVAVGQYEVPDALVEVFQPRGFQVSIPDEPGITLFAFHGKINEEFTTIHDGGKFSMDINKPINGRWTFNEPFAKLKVGDVLYYWLYVIYSADGESKLGYQKVDQAYEVKGFVDKNKVGASKHTTVRPTSRPATTTSIPVEPGDASTPEECLETVTKINNGRETCAGQLIFHEKFSNEKKLKRKWVPEVHFASAPDYEFVLYKNRPETLHFENGFLNILPQFTESLYGEGFCTKSEPLDLSPDCTGVAGSSECVQTPNAFLIIPPVTSAKISTRSKFSFKYGRVEIRAKLPKGNWIYPELFLSSSNEEYGPGYESGQMRVAFLQGNEDASKSLYGGCILGTGPSSRTFAMKKIRKNTSWANEFHKYSLHWTQDNIVLKVDGKVYGNISPPEGGFASQKANLKASENWSRGSSMAPFDKEVYLTIGVGVGGHNFEDRPDDGKPWRNGDPKSQKNFYRNQTEYLRTLGEDNTLQVDYVKVWAL